MFITMWQHFIMLQVTSNKRAMCRSDRGLPQPSFDFISLGRKYPYKNMNLEQCWSHKHQTVNNNSLQELTKSKQTSTLKAIKQEIFVIQKLLLKSQFEKKWLNLPGGQNIKDNCYIGIILFLYFRQCSPTVTQMMLYGKVQLFLCQFPIVQLHLYSLQVY